MASSESILARTVRRSAPTYSIHYVRPRNPWSRHADRHVSRVREPRTPDLRRRPRRRLARPGEAAPGGEVPRRLRRRARSLPRVDGEHRVGGGQHAVARPTGPRSRSRRGDGQEPASRSERTSGSRRSCGAPRRHGRRRRRSVGELLRGQLVPVPLPDRRRLARGDARVQRDAGRLRRRRSEAADRVVPDPDPRHRCRGGRGAVGGVGGLQVAAAAGVPGRARCARLLGRPLRTACSRRSRTPGCRSAATSA